MKYYKYDGHKGLRYFRMNADAPFPESERCVQVCVSNGDVKKGRPSCIGIYLTKKMTFANNYNFLSQVKECTKREFDLAYKKVLKMIQ